MKQRLLALLGAAAIVGSMTATAAFAQNMPKTNINVIGNISITTQFKQIEKPYWTELLAKASNGAITANFKGWDEMSLKGPEVFRLVQRGVAQFGTGQLGHVSGDAPINDATDLSGLSPTLDDFWKVTMAFRPVIEDFYAKEYGLKVLTMQSYQEQIFYCRKEVKSLADFKGLKMRSSGVSQADFLSALGATGVPLSFTEVQQALQTGVIDCAITGTLGGYAAKWYESAKHLYTLPVNFAAGMTVVNIAEWNKLDPGIRKLIEDTMKVREKEMFELNKKEGELGINCNTSGPCSAGPNGGMARHNASAADIALLKKVMLETVIPRWAERCGAECAKKYNDTIGKVTGLMAPVKS